MKETLWACGLDNNEVVVGIRLLQPGTMVRIRRATTILELPLCCHAPPVGMPLTWIGARDLDSLCDTDRQPG